MTLRLATVFSGIGAIEWALNRMKKNYEIVFACDNDKFVKQSYISNYNTSNCECEDRFDYPGVNVCSDHLDFTWYDDIFDINGEDHVGGTSGDIDLLVGGSPCQPFSIAGDMQGLDDERGSLIREYIRLIDEIRPGVFIYENVAGLKSTNNGRALKLLIERFEEMGYDVHDKILNARDYGIPQSRNRLFIVGFLDETEFTFPGKQGTAVFKLLDILEDSITHPDTRDYKEDWGLKARFELHSWKTEQELFTDHIEQRYILSETVTEYVLAGGSKNYYVEPVINPSTAFALLTTMHKMHRAGIDNYIAYDKDGNRIDEYDLLDCSYDENYIRKLTPRECLRLMGYDDHFNIVVSNTQMYRQCGNSIVVDVLISLLQKLLPRIEKISGNRERLQIKVKADK